MTQFKIRQIFVRPYAVRYMYVHVVLQTRDFITSESHAYVSTFHDQISNYFFFVLLGKLNFIAKN